MPLSQHMLQICNNGDSTTSSGLARCEAVLHGLWASPRGGLMYETRRRKPEPTLLPLQGIFNLPHHINYKHDVVSYTQRGNGLQLTAACCDSDWDLYRYPAP